MISLLLLVLKVINNVNVLFFVGATDKLPEPLSKEMEEYYLSLSSDGDLFARDKLIEHNLRLVVFLAKKYENTKVDLEDLVSIGTIGLIKGINTYSMGKNIKLATYASRCIDNEILMYLRKNKKIRTEVSFDESLSFDADGNIVRLASEAYRINLAHLFDPYLAVHTSSIEPLPHSLSLIIMRNCG